jgi:hypothetical protein
MRTEADRERRKRFLWDIIAAGWTTGSVSDEYAELCGRGRAAVDMGYENGDSIVYAESVDKRIDAIQSADVIDDDEADELQWLLQFRQDARDAVHVWEPPVSFVCETYWDKYAEEKAVDIYGREAVESVYFNLAGYSADLMEGYEEIDFNGTTYYGDGR